MLQNNNMSIPALYISDELYIMHQDRNEYTAL